MKEKSVEPTNPESIIEGKLGVASTPGWSSPKPRGLEVRVQGTGTGFRVQGSGFRGQGPGLRFEV